jgi:hypothetical protein
VRLLLTLACTLAVAAPATAGAQGGALRAPLEQAGAPVAVLHVALYNAGANVQEPTDSARAALSTDVLATRLGQLLPGQIVEGAAERARREGPQCNAVVSCARQVAADAGAKWVVLAKVSKTSNLIWLFTGQLVHVSTGTIVLDDSTELKGEPEAMVRAGTRIFAERVARTVKAGGVANDFPPIP